MVHVWSIALDHQSLKFYEKLLPSAWVGGRDKQVRAGKAGKFWCFLDSKTQFSNAVSPFNNQLTWNVAWKDAKSMSIIHPFYVKSFAPGKNWYFSYFTMFTNWTQLLTSNDIAFHNWCYILTNNNPEKSLDAPGIFHGLWMWVRFPLKCQYFDEFPMTFTSNLTLRWQFQASLWCQSFIRIPKTMNRIFSLLVTSLTEWSLWFLQPH